MAPLNRLSKYLPRAFNRCFRCSCSHEIPSTSCVNARDSTYPKFTTIITTIPSIHNPPLHSSCPKLHTLNQAFLHPPSTPNPHPESLSTLPLIPNDKVPHPLMTLTPPSTFMPVRIRNPMLATAVLCPFVPAGPFSGYGASPR